MRRNRVNARKAIPRSRSSGDASFGLPRTTCAGSLDTRFAMTASSIVPTSAAGAGEAGAPGRNRLELALDGATLDDVAGMRNLKEWLASAGGVHRRTGRAALDPPRGFCCSACRAPARVLRAKAIAGSWGVPLLRLDLGALYSKWAGETERQLRGRWRRLSGWHRRFSGSTRSRRDLPPAATITTAASRAACSGRCSPGWRSGSRACSSLPPRTTSNGFRRAAPQRRFDEIFSSTYRCFDPRSDLPVASEAPRRRRRFRCVVARACMRRLLRRRDRAGDRCGALCRARAAGAVDASARSRGARFDEAAVDGDGGAGRRPSRMGCGPHRVGVDRVQSAFFAPTRPAFPRMSTGIATRSLFRCSRSAGVPLGYCPLK